MKNVAWIVIGVFSFFCYSTFLSANDGKQFEYVLLLGNVEALASDDELPEVGITCGSPENKGRCWTGDCDKTCWTALGFYSCYSCPTATGNPGNTRIEDVPCW